jgi:exo-1,4-beta-D-glucosaminidase
VALFGHNDYFTPPLLQRYGPCSTARQVSQKAQVAAYESYRAYFEAYRLTGSSFVSWMLQNGRPQNQWHLIEYSGMLGGVFFGARAAAADPHVMLNPSNFSAAVYSRSPLSSSLVISCMVYDLSGSVLWSRSGPVSEPLTLPPGEELRFVELKLFDGTSLVDRNVYWIPADDASDVFNYGAPHGHYAPLTRYADLTGLDHLVQSTTILEGESHSDTHSSVTIRNSGQGVAFFVRLRLIFEEKGSDLLPAFWSNNFVTLFPGQTEQIQVDYAAVTGKKRFEMELYGSK